MSSLYTAKFFANHEARSRQSAALTVPLVLELVPAASVIDVGCGIGTWLAEFQSAGVKDYLGVDGDYVSRDQLLIDRARFTSHELSQPLEIGRRFDLATCLEVAEHLPGTAAQTLVDSLVKLAPVVLFSAAIPHQQGNHHINEQWPEYWHERFARRDYVVVDALRRRLWRNQEIARWYRQNLLFYVDRARLSQYPRLKEVFELHGDGPPLALVHPEHYLAMYGALFERMKQAQRLAMRATIQLRDINLVAFPDWSQPQQMLLQQLRQLYSTLVAHPQLACAGLVLHTGNHPQAAMPLIEQAGREVQIPAGTSPQMVPAVRGVGPELGASQWEVLLECCQARITLPGESLGTIEFVGANRLLPISLEDLAMRQPIQLKGFAP